MGLFSSSSYEEDPDDSGITQQRMLERFQQVFGNKQLGSDELDNLTQYCFDHVTELTCDGRRASGPGFQNRRIDLDCFYAACAGSDGMNYEHVLDLFDKERKRSFWEAAFTPREIKQAVTHTSTSKLSPAKGLIRKAHLNSKVHVLSA